MARFHERGSLILGIIAIILALLSVEEYKKIILNSDLIWIVVSITFMVLLYMLLDNALIYKTSLFSSILEPDLKVPSKYNLHLNPQGLFKLTTKDIQDLKRLYLGEYLIFSMVIMYTGVLLILIFLPRKSYIGAVLSLILMISMPLIGSSRFIERAKNEFSVRIEPETYFEICQDNTEFIITLHNNYKESIVTGAIYVLFPRDIEVRMLKNGRYSKISDNNFSANFKIDGIKNKNSKNVRPLKFHLKYTGSKERIDKIHVEIYARREYKGKLVPIEEYQPRVYVIPVYLTSSMSNIEDRDLEDRPLDQIEYELEGDIY